ncbi:MAG: DUF2130 domain-containing protein [Patescibacteria group bacterium]|nr:DUF2130 domain-containing protein [Patescibacteria group bacterium]
MVIEIDKALEGQIEQRVLAAAEHKHKEALEQVQREAALSAKKQSDAAQEQIKKEAAEDLEIAKKKLEAELISSQKIATAEHELLLQTLREDALAEKQANKQLREQLQDMMKALREEKSARENAELEAQKKVSAEIEKMRNEVEKSADEKQRLNLAAKEKTITDLQKALDDAQRKAAQGSQQLQGEIMELDFEAALAQAFRDDFFAPVPKGVKGGDIMQTVTNQRGANCGILIWEIKRTKAWGGDWTSKLKQDMRDAKANIPIIISEVLPKQISQDMGQFEGVWICKPALAVMLGTLLRKSLLDAAQQRALAENKGGKAESLYSYMTSHEFVQQIEAMLETYQDMAQQVVKERIAYEKLWAQREKQAQKLLMSTANIIGSMQGHIGQAAMPRIKGLELDSGLEDL